VNSSASPIAAQLNSTTTESQTLKKYILFDHDGVLVDTEYWYFKAGQRALSEVGIRLEKNQYLHDMTQGLGTWAQAKAAGINEQTINTLRHTRNNYYQHYLQTQSIGIDGVEKTLSELSKFVRMAIVTTSKRADFELIHAKPDITQYFDFVLMREDYKHAKPHPEPYLTGLNRFRATFGATKEETLIVEDSMRGLNSAVAAGIDCAIVYNSFTNARKFPGALCQFNKLTELKKIIQSEA